MWAANVFTASGNQQIEAVAFDTYDAKTRYEVRIYKNLTDPNNPSSGELQSAATTTGLHTYAGYHTVPLSAPVRVNAGENFSVVIQVDGRWAPGAGIHFPYESVLKQYSEAATASRGQSFYTSAIVANASTPWKDLTAWDSTANFCIRALANPAEAEPTPGGVDVWDGTIDTLWYERNPNETEFTISTAEQLAGLAYIVNGTGTLHDNFSGKTIRLVSDLDLDRREWTPIGSEYNNSSIYVPSFRGTFDGGGGTITNMKMEILDATGYAGLFGRSNGTLKGIHLTDVNINISSYYWYSVGGLAGENSGTITDCTASGNISYSFSSAASFYDGGSGTSSTAGGLVGANYSYGIITNCMASGNVYSYAYISSQAGGLVGVNSGTITDCTTNGNVSSYSYKDGSRAGGLVGWNAEGTITDCMASGNVSSYFLGHDYPRGPRDACAGGLVGWNGWQGHGGSITGCTASGKNISAINSGYGKAYTGGFIGMHTWGTTLTNNRNNTGVSPAIGYDHRKDPPGPSDDI
jgi:hypothetical protein